jgi:hypothetical protein
MTYEIDAVDVMEEVAGRFDGPEPAEDVAREWLERHSDGLEEALHGAMREYIARNWTGGAAKATPAEELMKEIEEIRNGR